MRLLLLLFLVITVAASAQKPATAIGSIDGQVFDSLARTPLEYVSVGVFNAEDSALVAGIFTDEKGQFALYDLPAGKLYLPVHAAGYEDLFISGVQLSREKPLRKLGNISLAPEDAEAIDEVVVVGQKDVLQTGIDKKV